jgi:hypothetical protein
MGDQRCALRDQGRRCVFEVEIWDDEAGAREEDEAGVPAERLGPEEEVGWRLVAAAYWRTGGIPDAADVAWQSPLCVLGVFRGRVAADHP